MSHSSCTRETYPCRWRPPAPHSVVSDVCVRVHCDHRHLDRSCARPRDACPSASAAPQRHGSTDHDRAPDGPAGTGPDPALLRTVTRLRGFRPESLSALLESRKVVRIVLMRGTVFAVSVADAHALRPWVQPLLDRDLSTNQTYREGLRGVDRAALSSFARELLSDTARSQMELRPLLAEKFPGHDPAHSRTVCGACFRSCRPRRAGCGGARGSRVSRHWTCGWVGRNRMFPVRIN